MRSMTKALATSHIRRAAEQLGLLVRDARAARGATPFQLAKRARIGYRTLVQIETGHLTMPTGALLSVLAQLGLLAPPAVAAALARYPRPPRSKSTWDSFFQGATDGPDITTSPSTARAGRTPPRTTPDAPRARVRRMFADDGGRLTQGIASAQGGARRRAQLLGNHVWLTEQQANALLEAANNRQTAAQMRASRELVAVTIDGVCLYPSIQFNPRIGSPRPVMAQLLAIIPPDTSAWDVIAWLFERRRDLAGGAPADYLDSQPQAAVRVAREDFDPPPSSW
ncbi:helix-turn-helix domain-containing protein [Dyella solisilvae]|nr:helix-turn-helix transcriptional regulator [Dyella solisilvae]